jgi:hypothetical protein
VAFLEKLALLLATNMDIFFPLFLILSLTMAPVLNSAAIPCTAQKRELKGFWLIHRCLTVTTALSASMERNLTPHHQAEGSLKKVKVLKVLGLADMERYFKRGQYMINPTQNHHYFRPGPQRK